MTESTKKPQPMQPVVIVDGVQRFQQNAIVRALLDHGTKTGFSLNEIALGDFSVEDHRQLAQLIGYSLSGFGSLNYVDDVTYQTAVRVGDDGESPEQARIKVLEATLSNLQDGMRGAVTELYGIHPDDLRGARF